jgi:ribosomal protein L12E/L44/L45/RPP1/RPP2
MRWYQVTVADGQEEEAGEEEEEEEEKEEEFTFQLLQGPWL